MLNFSNNLWKYSSIEVAFKRNVSIWLNQDLLLRFLILQKFPISSQTIVVLYCIILILFFWNQNHLLTAVSIFHFLMTWRQINRVPIWTYGHLSMSSQVMHNSQTIVLKFRVFSAILSKLSSFTDIISLRSLTVLYILSLSPYDTWFLLTYFLPQSCHLNNSCAEQ